MQTPAMLKIKGQTPQNPMAVTMDKKSLQNLNQDSIMSTDVNSSMINSKRASNHQLYKSMDFGRKSLDKMIFPKEKSF